jgi:hypothetical protein
MNKQEEEFNYAQDLAIDKNDLRRVCSDHPQLVMKYVKEIARQSREVKHSQESLGRVRSRLTKAFISAADKKPLVAEIEAHIAEHKEYQTARAEVENLEYEYDIIKGTMTALAHRKSMIQEVCRLLGINYFSAVEAPEVENNPGGKSNESAASDSRQAVNKRRKSRTARK